LTGVINDNPRVPQQVNTFPRFTEPKGSWQCLQTPNICLHSSKPDQPRPRPQPISLRFILMSSSNQSLRIPSGLLPSGFPEARYYCGKESRCRFTGFKTHVADSEFR